MKTITTIITQIQNNISNKESIKLIEEYADCLMKIMKAIQQSDDEYDSDDSDDLEKLKLINSIREKIKTNIVGKIQPLTMRNSENIGLSNKARFTFLDIYEGIQKF